jgi:hypothetical protein
MFTPWRWRDEHRQRPVYYDRTVVTGPFNSEIMEDVLLMKAFGIPNGVYWIDRPWGPGFHSSALSGGSQSTTGLDQLVDLLIRAGHFGFTALEEGTSHAGSLSSIR